MSLEQQFIMAALLYMTYPCDTQILNGRNLVASQVKLPIL